MDHRLELVCLDDGKQTIDIFNYYVENNFAAYPENKVPYEFFPSFLKLTKGYPFLVARDACEKVVGFGCLRPYDPMPAFTSAAEITYFVSPEHIDEGIGKKILDRLLEEAKKLGITAILASISSLNLSSLHSIKGTDLQRAGASWGRPEDGTAVRCSMDAENALILQIQLAISDCL